MVVPLLLVCAASCGRPPTGEASRLPPDGGPALLARVNPFIGTADVSGFQGGHTYPGAAVPFGMVAFSPDTSGLQPGGYAYPLTGIQGFSLTHLSGAGCPAFGDLPLLPVLGGPGRNPGQRGTNQPLAFRHSAEQASPGSYTVRLDDGIRVALTATARTAVGQFRFPGGGPASLLVNASGSTAGTTAAQITERPGPGGDRISGWVASGRFCGAADRYRLYFAGVLSGPVTAAGVWNGARVSGGPRAAQRASQAGPSGSGVGGYATFRPGATVTVRIGLSYVSVAGAWRNLTAESLHRSPDRVRAAAAALWMRLLSRVRVAGGSPAARTVFETALYHALLAPNVASDVDGRYRLPDGTPARVAAGHSYYTDFSGWDLYRAQAPLLAVVAPRVAGDVAASMVADARATGAFDRWTFAGGYTGVMTGDPYADVIADAAAFGAAGFPERTALRLLVHGATRPARTATGYRERPGLGSYLRLGYVPANQPQSRPGGYGWAATSLQYDIDDAALAALADRLGDAADGRRLAAQASRWRELFDPATGYLEPREARDGLRRVGPFPAGFPPTRRSGYVEGDAAQYTFDVPFDLPGLVAELGGPAATVRRLNALFRKLNAGAGTPYAALGNEPSIGIPWVYDAAGDPAGASAVVHRAARSLWRDAPDGEPGDDDLGAMSAWYVWAALGLYPEIPGRATLALSAPLFPAAALKLPDGRVLRVQAAGAPGRYDPTAITFDGRRLRAPWLPASAVRTGGVVTFTLTGPRAGTAG
jgi:predicted alpha-1,2-mannosidase